MENLENEITNAEDLAKIKQVLQFLVTQEKIRQQEIEQLNIRLTELDGYSRNYVDEQNFGKFAEKYGEKFAPYQNIYSKMNVGNNNLLREAYDDYNKMVGDEQFEGLTEEDFVQKALIALEEQVNELKKDLGLPENASVNIETQGDSVEVTADVNNDGEQEVIATSQEETEATTETEEEEKSPNGLSKEDQEDIDNAVNNYKPNH